MEYITERIINLSDYENKIHQARAVSDDLIGAIKNNNMTQTINLAKNLSLKLHELDDFEIIIERRKTLITSD